MNYYLGVLGVLCGEKLIRKIQRCELAVVFFCGFVIRLCGLDFVFEISDEFALAVNVYLSTPFLFAFFPGYTFVF